ncbi:TonB-dependent siderophore receptor [Brevundimonas sp. M20]|uniref:TonB-dependent receptor plug domain-containing protein n=1 Tax=Brevundimonas sp. M20 TaxID=2591463 RepID=UPI0011464BDF|nr:TonB-dependent receptor [Brevundimonas sp. M20]QDH71941.1 TonB-dependent receptor [Brevundimonas sp. M20]
MKRSILLSTAALTAALASPVFARSSDELPEVVVTATRIPAIVAETPGARVIDADTIQQRGAVFAADILTDVPGLSVTRSGAFGGVAQVRMRGATPGKTLVLVDGAPVNDAAEPNGAYDVSGFDLGDVERIEVLSGPQSSLWGSDAIGGVIAFTTREINGLRAEAEAGDFDTLRGRIAVGTANETWALGGYVSRFTTDGISVADEADGNPEADGFDNTTVGLRGRYAVSPAVKLDASARWSRSEADLDNGFPIADNGDRSESEQWSGVVRATVDALGLQHQFSVSGSDIERQTFSVFGGVFDANRQAWRWQANGETGAATYAFGLEREESEGSLSTGADVSLESTAAFATGRYQVTDALSVTGGLRFDDTDFGSKTTGRVSAAWDFGPGFTLSGAYGTGFKAPSVSQAACDFCFAAIPFPTLRPERAEGLEAAIGWRSADGRIEGRATVYRLKVEDQISFFFDTTTFDSYYVNIAETATDGVELEGRAALINGFDLSLAYAWTDAKDETTGARLLRVPEHAGSVTLGWTGDRLSGALTVRAEGDQDDSGGVRESFVTANVNAAYDLTDHITLTARVENLADEHYQQVLGYGEPGRSGYVGIRLRY